MPKDTPCTQCGNRFTPPYAWSKLCSPECAAARRQQRERQRNKDRLATPEGRADNAARSRRHWAKKYQRRRCERCGQETTQGRKRCEECRRPLPVPVRRHRPAAPDTPRMFTAGVCPGCNQSFTTLGHRTQYCSRPCAKRMQRKEERARRRARAKGAFVARVVRRRIYERDGWRCQLCTKLVRRDAEVPHPLAPTLDHIVPLASGGTHEPANVQCAHFICNSRKGANAMNDQLRLLG